MYSALVRRITSEFSSRYAPKDLLEVLDDSPIVTDDQYRFWEWMATYYMCTTGEVMTAALPASLKLSSQTKIILNLDPEQLTAALNDKRSEEHTSELQSLMRNSYAVFFLKTNTP